MSIKSLGIRLPKVVSRVSVKLHGNIVTPQTRRIRKWGDDIMVRDLGASVGAIGTTNFQVVPLFCFEDNTWSATSKWVRMERADVDKLALMQTEEAGATVKQKMNWLIYPGKHERPMWCESAKDADGNYVWSWENAPSVRAGVQVWGGQLIEVEGSYGIETKLPGATQTRLVEMTRIKTFFRRADFGVKTHALHPHIVNVATAAGRNDVYIDKPLGTIYTPACFHPDDFLLFGRVQVEAYYIPTAWLEVT